MRRYVTRHGLSRAAGGGVVTRAGVRAGDVIFVADPVRVGGAADAAAEPCARRVRVGRYLLPPSAEALDCAIPDTAGGRLANVRARVQLNDSIKFTAAADIPPGGELACDYAAAAVDEQAPGLLAAAVAAAVRGEAEMAARQ